MPRLIDADALYDIVMNYIKPMTTNEAIILQDFVALLEDAPTVDAKPVVRCKDCKWGNRYDEDLIECPLDLNNPPEYNPYDWYCPNGTRREDADK